MKVWLSPVEDHVVTDTTEAVYGFWDGDIEELGNQVSSVSTPEGSQNRFWVQILKLIISKCFYELNHAFETCQSDLESIHWDQLPPEQWEKLLDEAFEHLRTQKNAVIDESKAKAKSCIQEIPPETRDEAVEWFAKGFFCVLGFWEFVGGAFGKAAEVMKKSVGEAWVGVLRALRVGVAMRAVVAAERIQGLGSTVESDKHGRDGRHAGVLVKGVIDYWRIGSIILLVWMTDRARITGYRVARRAFARWFRRLRRF